MAVAKESGARLCGFLIDDGTTPRVGFLASGKKRSVAEKTFTASNDKRHNHPISLFYIFDRSPDFLDNPHELMPQDISTFHSWDFPPIDMKV